MIFANYRYLGPISLDLGGKLNIALFRYIIELYKPLLSEEIFRKEEN